MGGKPSSGWGTSLLAWLFWEDVGLLGGITKLVTKEPIRKFTNKERIGIYTKWN